MTLESGSSARDCGERADDVHCRLLHQCLGAPVERSAQTRCPEPRVIHESASLRSIGTIRPIGFAYPVQPGDTLSAVTYRSTLTSRNTVLLPEKVGRLRGGLWLHSACRGPRLASEDVSSLLSRIDIRLVPGKRILWEPICGQDIWNEIVDRASESLGARPHTQAVLRPFDIRRERFGVLFLSEEGHHLGFAKVGRNPLDPLHQGALRSWAEQAPSTFWAPSLLYSARIGDWSLVLTDAMPNERHTPARISGEARRAVVSEYQSRLQPLADTPIAHGDFGPWNVRRLRSGRLAIIDWEECTTAPLATDELWHAMTTAAIQQIPPSKASTVVLESLKHHPLSEIRDAARRIRARDDMGEPEEVAEDAVRPGHVKEFERRLDRLLREVERHVGQ